MAAWPGCGGALFLFILPEKAPLPSAPLPPYSCLWLYGHLQLCNSLELFRPGLEMKVSRVSAVPPPGQWSGSAEPLGLVILPGFIPESLCVCVCVSIDFSFWSSFRFRANLRSKYKDFQHTLLPLPTDSLPHYQYLHQSDTFVKSMNLHWHIIIPQFTLGITLHTRHPVGFDKCTTCFIHPYSIYT